MIIRLQTLSAQDLKSVLEKVESNLAITATKKCVVETLFDLNHCSLGSSGIEKSLLNVLRAKNVSLSQAPRFAALMRVTNPVEHPAAQTPAPAQVRMTPRLNLRGVSLIKFEKAGDSTVHYLDGAVESVGNLDERNLRSNCTLLEFNS